MSEHVTKDYLKASLVQVGQKVYKLVSNPNFKPRTRVNLKRIPTEIGFDENGVPTGGAKWEEFIFERPWVVDRDIPEDVELKQATQNAITAIVQLYNMRRLNVKHEIKKFKLWIAEKALSNNLDSSAVDEGVRIFIEDLEKIPVTALIRVLLLGVAPRRSSMSIGKNITIKKVSKEDLTLEYDISFPPQKSPFPHSIAEIRMDVHNRSELLEHQFAVERLVSILRLFKAWPVYLTSYSINFPSITSFGIISNPSVPLLGVKRNIIEPADEKCLEKLYHVLLPIMSKDIVYKDGKDEISIAYKLYSDALTREKRNDWKLATLVAGLEAIYVSERHHKKYKLKRRAGKLLGYFSETPENVCAILEESYNIRNSVFHGDILETNQVNAIPEYLSLTYEYLRKSILIFLFLIKKEELDKYLIIGYIEDSLKGGDGEKKLIKILESIKSEIRFSFKELGIS